MIWNWVWGWGGSIIVINFNSDSLNNLIFLNYMLELLFFDSTVISGYILCLGVVKRQISLSTSTLSSMHNV